MHIIPGKMLLRPVRPRRRVRPEEVPEEHPLEAGTEEQVCCGLRIGVPAQPPEALFGGMSHQGNRN